MIVQVVAVLTYAVYLFLPGYLVLAAARIDKNQFLLSYGISISIVVVTLLPFTLFGGEIVLWVGILHVVIAFLVFGANELYKKRIVREPAKHQTSSPKRNNWPVFGCLGLLVSFSLYHLVVGPYTEIPSDFWKHLARVGTEFHFLAEGYVTNRAAEGFGNSRKTGSFRLSATGLGLLVAGYSALSMRGRRRGDGCHPAFHRRARKKQSGRW